MLALQYMIRCRFAHMLIGCSELIVATLGKVMQFLLLQYIRSPVSTLCVGQAASMASLLLCAGEHGSRRSLPNSRIMLHQPSGGSQVCASHSETCHKQISNLS